MVAEVEQFQSERVTLNGELMFPKNYIAAEDLRGRDVNLTIAGVFKEELRVRGGAKLPKHVATFRGTTKKFVINDTNARMIALSHGPRAEQWIGKQITIYPTTTTFGSKTVPCIRVRPPATPQGTETREELIDALA